MWTTGVSLWLAAVLWCCAPMWTSTSLQGFKSPLIVLENELLQTCGSWIAETLHKPLIHGRQLWSNLSRPLKVCCLSHIMMWWMRSDSESCFWHWDKPNLVCVWQHLLTIFVHDTNKTKYRVLNIHTRSSASLHTILLPADTKDYSIAETTIRPNMYCYQWLEDVVLYLKQNITKGAFSLHQGGLTISIFQDLWTEKETTQPGQKQESLKVNNRKHVVFKQHNKWCFTVNQDRKKHEYCRNILMFLLIEFTLNKKKESSMFLLYQ